MRIGIDCRTILNPEKGEGAGIGHYIYQLVRHLLKIDKENSYYLFFDRSVQKKRLDKFKQKNVFIRFFPFQQYKKLMPNRYQHHLTNAIFEREKLDILHFPHLFPGCYYQGPSVVTIHDLTPYKLPDFSPEKDSQFLKKIIPDFLKKTNKIIAVSKATADDIKNIFVLDKRKVEVIYNGVDQRFFKNRTKKDVLKIKKKLGISKKYLLFLGTVEPRKNIIRIIESYERLRQGIGYHYSLSSGKKDFSKYQLILAGAKGFRFKDIEKRISVSKYKKDIILPGYVDSEDLGPLFEGAEMFVFPSLYEGFGLPILEAMAKKIPVITSNISSMPEISQKAALLVAPNNVAEITRAIFKILIDNKIKEGLQKRGITVAKKYSWEKCAKKTLAIYKKSIKVK